MTDKHKFQEGIARYVPNKIVYGELRPYLEGSFFFGCGSIETVYRRDVKESGTATPICVDCHEEKDHINHL